MKLTRQEELEIINDHLSTRVDELSSEVKRLMKSVGMASSTDTTEHMAKKWAGKKRGRKPMSAKARKAIGDAQRKRWAAQKKASNG